MKERYARLNNEFKTAVWSSIVVLGLFVLCIPFFFFSLMEIPQGILLGGVVGIIIYLLFGIFDNPEKPKKSMTYTIVLIVVKFLVIAGILFLVGWLYYKVGFKAFNIFAVMGGYMIPLVTYIVIIRKEKMSGDSREL